MQRWWEEERGRRTWRRDARVLAGVNSGIVGQWAIQIMAASLSVLSSLPSQSSHPLLSPLLSHRWLQIIDNKIKQLFFTSPTHQNVHSALPAPSRRPAGNRDMKNEEGQSRASSTSLPSSAYSSSCSRSSSKPQWQSGAAEVSSSKMSSQRRLRRQWSERLKRREGGKWALGGNSGSIPTRSELSTIAGMMRSRTGQFTSRQGLQFTSISHVLNSRSIMKSSPKISKLLRWRRWSMVAQLARTTQLASSFIRGSTSRSRLRFLPGQAQSRQRWNSEQESLLAGSYFWQSSLRRWTASLVRWTKGLSRSSRSKGSLLVRMQPSRYQQALRRPLTLVSRRQCRMSNFRPQQRKGRLMQLCTMQVTACPFSCRAFRSRPWIPLKVDSVIPFPRLLFSPGFTIHTRSGSPWFSRTNCLNSGESAARRWQVRGMQSKGSWLRCCRKWESERKRFFLEPMQQLRGRWLESRSGEKDSKGTTQPSLRMKRSTDWHFQAGRILRLRSSVSSCCLLLACRSSPLPARCDASCPACTCSTIFCDQQKCRPLSGCSTTSHQNLRLMRLLTSSELLPRATQARYLGASSGLASAKGTQRLLEQLILKRKSRKLLSLRLYCPSPSPLSWKHIARDCWLLLIATTRLPTDVDAARRAGASNNGFFCTCGSLSAIVKQTIVRLLRKGLRQRAAGSRVAQSLLDLALMGRVSLDLIILQSSIFWSWPLQIWWIWLLTHISSACSCRAGSSRHSFSLRSVSLIDFLMFCSMVQKVLGLLSASPSFFRDRQLKHFSAKSWYSFSLWKIVFRHPLCCTCAYRYRQDSPGVNEPSRLFAFSLCRELLSARLPSAESLRLGVEAAAGTGLCRTISILHCSCDFINQQKQQRLPAYRLQPSRAANHRAFSSAASSLSPLYSRHSEKVSQSWSPFTVTLSPSLEMSSPAVPSESEHSAQPQRKRGRSLSVSTATPAQPIPTTTLFTFLWLLASLSLIAHTRISDTQLRQNGLTDNFASMRAQISGRADSLRSWQSFCS